MKRKLLAALVLGFFAGVANAQTNVTIYGIVDAGISRTDNGAVKTTELGSGLQSGSRIGFRGTEDLGGGLAAIFALENGFNVDTGTLGQSNATTTRLFGRQAFVGLQGGFGAVRLGRQYNPIRTAVETIDPFNHGLAGNASNVFNVYGERTDNTISYATPVISGFSGQINYGLGEVAGDNSRARTIGASVGYANGPINVILAHHNFDTGTAAAAGTKAKTTFLGATYDFRLVKVHAAYATNKTDTAALATRVDRDEALLGVSAPIGAAGTVLVSWIHRKDDTPTANDADQYAIGYIHNLSKRTNLYTSFAKTKNDPTGRLNNPAAAGGDPSVFNVGIRHRF